MSKKKRECDQEEVTMDMTPMIDVVFLLIIFFILMPPKEMEGQLQSYLPTAPSDQPPQNEEPPPIFHIVLHATEDGDKVRTLVTFNNAPVGSFESLSIRKLNEVYKMDKTEKNRILGEEYVKDKKQFDPDTSEVLSNLMNKMTAAAVGSSEGKDTDVMIDAATNVPFKVVLSILNTGHAAKFPNIKFTSPNEAVIFKKD